MVNRAKECVEEKLKARDDMKKEEEESKEWY
jgi:hypothetical protein